MVKKNLIYLPLGGSGEVGMNMYIYGYGEPGSERFIMVDLGVTFPDMETSPGVNLIFPDLSWIVERKDRLDAIFITHAHEDHIGGLGHFYDRLDAPIFVRKFTAHIALLKLEEHGCDINKINIVESMPQKVSVGEFDVSFVPVSHSIPEASALVIDSPAGRIVHSGDFKLDTDPGLGDPFDEKIWSNIGEVKALVCDSTNVFSTHSGRSEESLKEPIKELINDCSGMVVATTFASNIARVRTLANIGVASGRSVVLLGAALNRMISAGFKTGVITDFPAIVSPDEALDIARENLLLIVTGSQGERRAASAQLSKGKFKGFSLRENDLFLFSSKVIPGNEVAVSKIINNLSEIGVDVIDESMGHYHVSGHANRPDLKKFHQLINPQVIIPMHGEHRMLREHCKLAAEQNINSVLATNGTVVALSGSASKVINYVETGRIYQDGSNYIGSYDGVIRDRIKIAVNGQVIVNILIDENDELLDEVSCELVGLSEKSSSENNLCEVIENEIISSTQFWSRKDFIDDVKVKEQIKRLVKKTCSLEIGKKPEVLTIISRLA